MIENWIKQTVFFLVFFTIVPNSYAQTEWSTPQRLDGELILKSVTANLPQGSFYVSVNGDDSTGAGTVENPWKTITFALTQLTPDSLNNDTLHVLPGRYSPSATGESFPLNLPSFLTLKGAGRDSTVLDAEAVLDSILRRVINIIGVNESVIQGFTITGGFASENPGSETLFAGGGILISNSTNIIIRKNKIVQNHAVSLLGGAGFGGGIIILEGGHHVIHDNIFEDNDSFGDVGSGGGLYMSGSVIVTNNTFSGNITKGAFGGFGGGILSNFGGPYLIAENLITENFADREGGGIGLDSGVLTLVIRNNISNNIVDQWGGGITFGGNRGNVVLGGSEGNGNNITDNVSTLGATGKGLYTGSPEDVKYINAEDNYFGNNVNPNTDFNIIYPLDVFDTDPFSEDTIIFKDTRLVVFQPKLDFGTLTIDSTTERTFTIANLFRDDDSTLGITSALIDDDQFSVMEMPTSIGNGKFSTAVISFTPNIEGEAIGELTIESSSGTEYVSLTGIGNGIIGIDKEDGITLPEDFVLYPAYPNPFNPETKIDFALPEAGLTRLIIYDLLGREVDILIDVQLSAGYHSLTWNAANVASGIYFYRLTSGSFVATKKLLLLK